MLVLISCSIRAYTQEHMVFNGIELSSHIHHFGNELISKGFDFTFEEENNIYFKGLYKGEPVDICASVTTKDTLVYSVTVYYEAPKINDAKNYYHKLQKFLVRDFGSPEKDYADDKKAMYFTTYRLKSGFVFLYIKPVEDFSSFFVFLNYVDKQCLEKYKAEGGR